MKFLRRTTYQGLVMLTLLGLLLAPLNSWAGSDANAQNFNPAIDTSKNFTVYSSQTMQQWQWGAGMFLNYAYRPVEFGVAGTRIAGIIDHLVMADAWATLGVMDWMQIGLDIPVALYEKYFDPSLPPGTAPGQSLARMGDIRLEMKFRLLNDILHPVGLAIRPFITFPTGSGAKLTGSSTPTGGASLIFDAHFAERVFLAVNFGFLFRGSARPANLNVQMANQFLYSLGLAVKALEWMYITGEIFGTAKASDLFGNEAETPLEALGGFRFWPKDYLRVSVAGGAGITFGYGSPDFRGVLEVSYIKPRVVDLPPPPPPPPPPIVRVEERRIVITEKIHFEFDKARIRPISFHILDAVVDVLQRHPAILRVQIEGHTDAVGTDAYNMRLSQRRSNSVMQYLTAHGVAANRLVAKGFGESVPIDTNDTALGRARNRRTEFKILERAAPTTPPPAPASY